MNRIERVKGCLFGGSVAEELAEAVEFLEWSAISAQDIVDHSPAYARLSKELNMPIRPHPFTFECVDCDWKKTVAPKSDCLWPEDFFARCPKCGSEALKIRTVSRLERFLVELWPHR